MAEAAKAPGAKKAPRGSAGLGQKARPQQEHQEQQEQQGRQVPEEQSDDDWGTAWPGGSHDSSQRGGCQAAALSLCVFQDIVA